MLDNLLGNAVKYAQSGTRLYLELTPGETETVLTLKNISREPLNIPAEELMERFVRGDGKGALNFASKVPFLAGMPSAVEEFLRVERETLG